MGPHRPFIDSNKQEEVEESHCSHAGLYHGRILLDSNYPMKPPTLSEGFHKLEACRLILSAENQVDRILST